MELTPRVPPHNNDAEISVLGSILLENDVMSQLGDTVAPEMFYREGHRKIFAAMQGLQERGEPVDLVTLSDELTKRGSLDDVGGLTYLIGLSDQVPTSAYAEHYARLVQEKYTLRQLISASSQAMKLAYDGQLPLEDLLDKAEKMIFEVAEHKKKGEQYQAMSEVVHDTFEYITLLHSNKGIPDGVATGFRDLDEQISGLQKGSLNVLAARPSMGKCLTAGTLIDVPGSGERLSIEQFVRRQEPQVYGLSERGELRVTAVSAWIDSGVKPVRRVTTRTGRVVETTLHHPFLGVDGWTPLYDLKVGDKLAVPRQVPSFGQDTSWTFGRVRLLAYLIAEGGLTQSDSTQSSPRFTNADPELVADFKACMATEFPELEVHQDGIDYRVSRTWQPGERKNQANPLTDWLRELGLWGQSSHYKRFPAAVWRFDQPRLAEFLRVLLSCDGTIYALGQAGYGRIEFTVASPGLAEDVQHAFVRFGLVAKRWQKTEQSWRVELTEGRSVAAYQARIGWTGEKARREFPVSLSARSNVGHLPPAAWSHVRRAAETRGLSLLAMAKAGGENVTEGFNLHISRGLPQARAARYAAVLDDPHLSLLSSPDLYWDEIERIEDLGEQQVYDLTVPDGSNFVAADICVHNTAFALSIAQNVALRGEKTVAVFSLEMPSVQLALRMLCNEARVDMNRIRSGQLNERDFERLAHAAGRLAEAPMVIDDEPDLTVNALRSKLRRIQAQYGNLGLVVIDYLQLMSGSKGSNGGNENRQQEISLISRNLKSIARELEVPVMVLSQLSRAVEQRPNHRPMLSDLRESGAIEQDADIVMFIYRDEYYNKETDQQGIAEIIIGKQRNGPVGTVKLQFHSSHVRFNDLAGEA
jgi:replicative DNA helicase